jgi:acyl transferase domain-containing protein/NAD(P)-dependent dehydrogenase (short-subunit alcohol dehydrogenase family)/acyl carrier protein
MNPAPVADTNVLRVVADHNTAPQETVSSGVDLTLIAQNLITELLADVTKLAAEKLHPDEPFENFGVDSLMINSLNRELEKHFGELSKTLFFEYLTIGELAEYLAQEFADTLMSMSGQQATKTVVEDHMTTSSSAPAAVVNAGDEDDRGGVVEDDYSDDDIAIIGLAGRYPMAENLDAFWNNLQQGLNCITEIPPERWSFGDVFDAEKRVPGRTYSKWGGFLDDVDRFDPLFFKISPREAELLDPQERLFLECAWHTMEDAGYTRDKLGARVGVYAGVMWGQYELYGVGQPVEGQGVPGASYSSIANRVSYTFNFNGPSIAIDTMCSSSLTAIHLACQSIREGDIDYAFAGGVNVSSHPNKYLQLSQARYMSSEGLCRAFGEGGDGYVPGEGVGIVLLKSLKKAIADSDNIYAVIKASTLNHGGHVSGYTVPNPKAQGSLIKDALQRAHWAPETISYIEAHGSGTPLGDPIEITGLNRAFSEGAATPGSCAIGSVKSNIGHLESAAGIAGLTKVLLQMKHRKLVPSIHTDRLNPDLRLDDTPFYVQTQLSEWNPPRSADGALLPLRAGVSSFGAGGSNAHLLVEAFATSHVKRHETSPGQWWIVPVSARNESGLRKQVENLAAALAEVHSRPELTLENFASTLQNGREHQSCRLAFVVDSLDRLSAAMHAYLNGEPADLHWFEVLPEEQDGSASRGRVQDAVDLRSADIGTTRTAAENWARGMDLDWNAAGYSGRSISIPGYAFERRRCWVKPLMPASMEAAPLHPMLDRNQSTFRQQRFYKKLSLNDRVVVDHRIKGQYMLPGAAVIEMAYSAASLSGIQQLGAVQDIAWLNPLTVEDSREVFLSLDDTQDIRFELSSGNDENKVVYARGSIKPGVTARGANIDIEAIEKRCAREISGEQHYAGLASSGFEYGETLRSVKRVKVAGNNELLAQLSVEPAAGGYDHWILNPALIDGALQCISHLLEQAEVPFTCDSVSIFEAPGDTCLVWVKRNSVSGFDLVIAGHDGRVLVAIEGLSSLRLEKDAMHTGLPHLYTPFWDQPDEQQMSEQAAQRLVIFEHVFEDVRLPQASGLTEVIRVRLDHQGELSQQAENLYRVNPAYMQSCAELIKQLAAENRTPDTLVICSKSAMHSNAESVEDALHASLHAVSGLALALINARVKSPVRILFVYPEDIAAIDRGIGASYPAVSGLAATIGAEHPNINVSLLEVSRQIFTDRVRLGEAVLREIGVQRLPGERVRENDRELNVLRMREIENLDVKPVSLRSDGVYIITGGNGGLGRVFATYLAAKNAGTIVLTGRRDIESVDLSALEPYRERIQYRQVDVCDADGLAAMLDDLRAQSGSINGIIHCAGVVRDAYLMRKTPEQIDQVVSPKVLGTINLDRLTAQDELDFFHLFSSVSSRIGNPGQTDYAYANGFLDNFAEWRAGKVRNGQRHGHSCAIGWSLWRDGGMQIDESLEKLLEERFGVRPLETDQGIRAWEAAFGSAEAQLVVVEGDADKIARHIHVSKVALPDVKAAMAVAADKQAAVVKSASPAAAPEHVRAQLKGMLQELMADIFKLQASELKENVSFDDFGMDSVAALNIIEEMEKRFGKLPKTVLYEYPDLASLVTYLMQSHGEKIAAMLTVQAAAEPEVENAFDVVAAYLTGLVAQTTGATIQDIGLHTPVESYGMDSVKILELVSRLERDLGSLPKTLLFEYPTVEKLARYVVEHHAGKLSFLSASPVQGGDQESRVIESIAIESSGIESSGMEQEIAQPIASDVHSMDEPVAIIGISGRYPGADNLDKFWSNIAGGVDSISEVPEARWNSSNIFSSEQAQADKTYSKWGGFVSEVDCFDPLFFRISPREARKMDPQERLFLQCAWHTLEDANYTRQQLKDSHVGVFVGVMWSEYQLYTHSKKPDDPYPSASFSSIANRVSYSFDFRGPSMAVDTMCSSSLTAIHLACNSLRSGECDYALAGGVNLNLHPNKYLLLSDARFLSSDGRCRAFGEGGDGYVPGEGVGAVLLKPLSKAVQDGDPIYAVIHGSAVNHGGNATGYSVPNPEAQAKVIESALKQSGWKASSIDYIEAHGTGTSLGDPIEIAGLGRALPGIDPLHKKPIGSVKSNIGHLEAAAGIAGLTKIVLQMRHGKIAPSLHAEKTNPYIEFDDSGLFVPGQLMQWEPNNGHGRRAALSSFGAGGSNAHLLIEDYAYGNAVEESQDESMLPVFVYSASDDHSLSQLLRTHRDYLQKTLTADMPGFTLDVYARNLLAGREARESRVAVLASEISELIRKLDALISNNSVVAAGVYRGNGKQTGTDASMLNALLDQQAWERLAEYWVNTESAIANTSIRVTHRVPCMQPVYPFAKERYWIGEVELPKQSYGSSPAKQALHPLIDENRSTLIEQKYRKAFSGNEFYLNDHMVSGHHVMPAAVYIEMARAASAMANPQGILTEITNIDFSDAYIHEEDSAEIDIRLAPDQGLVRFSIENSGSAETKSYCKGSVRYSREAVSVPRSALNIDALKARHEKVSSLNKLYDSLASAGLVYGKTMRCVRDVWSGEKELVADLALTVGSQDASLANMLMHPALVDSAFQLVSMFDKKAVSQYLPFSIAKIYLYGSPGECCSVVIRKNDKAATNIKYFDIDFYDDAGGLLVSMHECAFRRSKTTVLKPVDDGKHLKDPLLHVDSWEETGFREKVAQGSAGVASGVLLFVYEDEALHGYAKVRLPQNLAAKVVSVRLSQQFAKHGDDAYDVPGNDEQAMAALIADVTADGQHISAVITLLKNVSPIDSANGEYVRDLGTAFLLGKLVGAQEIGRPVKYVHLRVGDGEQHRCHMIAGMSRSMHAENRQAAFSIVGMDRDPGQALPEICARELQECRSVNEIAYQNGKRYSRSFRAATEINENPTPPIYDGACVITGGLGGLGYMVATHLAHKVNSGHAVKLALLGRSKRGERESRLLEKLQQQGADVIYIETDIADAQQAAAAVAEIKQRFGKISSIYHCAGITDDKLIRNKHMDDVLRVTSPKINGIAHLDRLTLHEPLQHVVLFSSLSAIVAPPGQADYAAANGFLDAFADARQALVDKGLRNGKTVSIDWPLWKDGGARVTADVEAWMETSLAMSPLSEDRGMTLLFSALHAKASKFAVLANSGEQSVPDLKAS